MKICTKCEKEKLESEFGYRKTGKDQLQSKCKACMALYSRLNRRGLSEEDWERICLQQMVDERIHCRICLLVDPDAIDHCHSTGQVRGIIHKSCNSVLGSFDEDVDRLLKAAAYLRRAVIESVSVQDD